MATKPPGMTTSKTVYATSIARIHTYLAFSAFLTALGVGCLLHYKKIVKNSVAGYPEEWFPSVSATIGDWYPERNMFQVLIALTSGPRFAITYLQYYVHSSLSPKSSLPGFVFFIGVVRTLACGGWVYVPSYEAHDFHDFAMIAYIVCNIPWMFGGLACSGSARSRRRRKWVAGAFFGSLVPLVYFFIQHKVHRVPGAYTRYAFFEWGLIFLDVLYDSATELDFATADLQIAINPSLATRGITASATVDMKSSASSAHSNGSGVATTLKASAMVVTTETKDELGKATDVSRSVLGPFLRGLFTPTERHTVLSFMSDVYLSFIFWTLYTALAPSFFYYSVWQLGVAGHELTLLTTLSPAVLALEGVGEWVRGRGGRTMLWAVSLVGIACYISRLPLVRMLCVGAANASLALGKAVDWSDPTQAGYEGMLLGLGLVLSSLAKHAHHSNNPVWPIVNEKSGGWNKTGILLAILALYEYYTRSRPKTTSPSEDGTQQDNVVKPRKSASQAAQESWLPASLALGSLLFTLHQLLADSGTLITWSWTGYPITGPVPNLHGAITLVTQAVGLLAPLGLATFFTSNTPQSKAQGVLDGPLSLLSHPAWFALGAASAYTLYAYDDWVCYAGGLAFAVFLMSIVPSVLHRAAMAAQGGNAHKVFFTAWLVVSVLDFVSTMTVAYAFVPGAQIFRERTNFVLATQLLLLLPAFQAPKRHWPKISLPTSTTATHMRNFLALTSVLAVVVTLYRLPANSPQPYRAGPRIIRAGIWTVHFGIDDEGRDSQRRMRDLIKDMELDVVGLLETDLQRIPYGNRDLTRVMSEELGFNVDLGPGPDKHTWGAVLLSKYPILNSTHHLLPSPHGELAPAIEAVLDVYGTEVVVVVAHNGQEEDPLDRELQSKELARIMASHETRPVIFLGYVVTKPKAERPAPYQILIEDGNMHDIDHDDWDRWCEYILYRGLYRTAYARVSRSTITDTELQLGQWILPKHGHSVTDDSVSARYIRSRKEALPEDHWFPMEYYGSEGQGGKRGHFYHVFGTPLYYQLPEGAVV